MYIPSEVRVYVAKTAGGPQQLLGVAEGAAPSTKSQSVAITVTGDEPISGRFIYVQATAPGGWVFSDEMTPYAAGRP